MSHSLFESFCLRACVSMGIPMPALDATADGEPPAITLTVEGVVICLMQPPGDERHAVLMVEFGVLPSERTLQACLALLEANFLAMGSEPAVFARHPLSGAIVLHQRFVLADADAGKVEACVRQVAQAVLQWREHHFLAAEEDAAASAAPTSGVFA
ncbi:CesT family type III secretion system chaperone [Ramlibacter sp. AN1015]|uniref:CesT family type III secretion system chaperone n=1 Tax=Ramlibacter sp. AN1015 TaxID=3133428 RepID=UPI0030BC2A39